MDCTSSVFRRQFHLIVDKFRFFLLKRINFYSSVKVVFDQDIVLRDKVTPFLKFLTDESELKFATDGQ